MQRSPLPWWISKDYCPEQPKAGPGCLWDLVRFIPDEDLDFCLLYLGLRMPIPRMIYRVFSCASSTMLLTCILCSS